MLNTTVPAAGAAGVDHASPDTTSANRFAERLRQYQQWREQLAADIQRYQTWIEQQGLNDGQQDLQTYELMEDLKSDKLILAFVAEFSRGKTELVNAVFFADHKQRLLPSSAGRTTMCPTELMYDERQDPYIRLLPIETRKTSVTIEEYKRTPVHWTTLYLHKPNSTKDLSEAFQEVVRTKKVSLREAQELGLYHAPNSDVPVSNSEMIEIPVWRHAVINYPHPLLKQGLVVLDTPGLNALGVEPELSLSMLPRAHAIFFVLAADTGVSKTDMAVWNDHVRMALGEKPNGATAVLNKIDTLWDGLQDEGRIAAEIERQTRETADILGLRKDQVVAVSAQKGLIGKIKSDNVLLYRSGLPALEDKLAHDVLPAKQRLLRERLVRDFSQRVETTGTLVRAKLQGLNTQTAELRNLGGKSLDTIRTTIEALRKGKEKYDKELQAFQATREALARQAEILFGYFGVAQFDKLIVKTRQEMQESWTTRGLKTGIAAFFEGAGQVLQQADEQLRRVKFLVEGVYRKLQTEYDFVDLKPVELSLQLYRDELKRIEVEAEAFRNSPMMAMTEQHFVIKKFFITMVSRTREVFNAANIAAKNWFQALVSPLYVQLRDHKAGIEQRIEGLKKVQGNLDNVHVRLAELETLKKGLEEQHNTIEAMQARIRQPWPQ